MTRRRETPPQTSRRAAREFAFRVLFEAAQGGESLQDTLARAESVAQESAARGGDEAYPALGDEALSFARTLVQDYAARETEVNDLLRRIIQGWSFSQMAQTDLNVLRLAASELSRGETPEGAVIESAVRIARKFGGDDSGRFVNGVLGSLVRAVPRPDEDSGEESGEDVGDEGSSEASA